MGLASFRRETENFETLQLNFQELSGVRLASDDMRRQRIAAVDCGIERKTAAKENTNVALHGMKKKEAER